MAAKYIVDTHALIWYLESNAKLGNNAKNIFDDPSSEMVLPMIALAEAAYLVDKGRTKIPDVAELFLDVTSDPRIEVIPT